MAADASFNTVTLSISVDISRSNPRFGTPSTTISGELSPSVLAPLILNVDPSDPGCPERVTTTNPGNRPAIEFDKLTTGARLRTSPFTVVIEPVMVAAFAVPYPTTTNSSNVF